MYEILKCSLPAHEHQTKSPTAKIICLNMLSHSLLIQIPTIINAGIILLHIIIYCSRTISRSADIAQLTFKGT